MPRTRLELERALSRAGAPDDVVASVLDRFADVGLIDDTSYAEAYMRTGVGVRRRGTRSLRAELRVRGVAPDVIDVASGRWMRRASGRRRLPSPADGRRRSPGWSQRFGAVGSPASCSVAGSRRTRQQRD